MLQTETTSALELFEQGLSKSDIKVMAEAAVHSVLERGNVLQVMEALSAMADFIKEIKDTPAFKEYGREEISKYPKGFVSPSGAKLECAEVGVKYDFTKCGHKDMDELQVYVDATNEKIDEMKKFLKTVPQSGMVITNEFTGETYKVFPPSKTSTSSYKVSLSK